MSGLPSNIAPADISASEVPDGFSLGPGAGGGAGGVSDQAAQKAAQRESILQQAMTPDALARLRRVKVCCCFHTDRFAISICVLCLWRYVLDLIIPHFVL